MMLKDKIVLITGASSGIGEAFARRISKQGAIVVLQARSEDKLSALANDINTKGGIAHFYPTDLTNSIAVIKQAAKIKSEVGIPDIIVNSAGSGNWLSVFETSDQEFHDMMASPYFATVYTINAFKKDMVKRNNGHIISINSAASYFVFPGALGYLSARWALRAFQDGLHEELRSTNVAVSSIVAAKVDSPYFTNNPISAARLPKIGTSIMKTLTVDEVAKEIERALLHRKKTIIIPWQMSLSVFMNRFFPGVFRVLMRATGYKGIPSEISKIRKDE